MKNLKNKTNTSQSSVLLADCAVGDQEWRGGGGGDGFTISNGDN